MNFWQVVSRFILKQRIFILLVLAAATIFLGTKIQNIKFSHTEANLLPRDHEDNIKYDNFLEIFGEEGNLILLAVKDSAIFNVTNFNKWTDFSKKFDSFPQVDFTVSVGDIKKLKKDKENQRFFVEPLYQKQPTSDVEVKNIKDELFNNLPFFDNFLFNKKTGTIQTAIYLDQEILNTDIRERFVFDVLNPLVEEFEKDTGLDVRVSGMPFIR